MGYSIEYTLRAEIDLNKIIDYLINELYSNQAAKNFIEKIDSFEEKVKFQPYAFPIYKGHRRKFFINNYLLIYSIEQTIKKVYVERIVYAKMDLLNRDI